MNHKTLIDRMQRENVTICEFCGATKQGLSFVIGAGPVEDWVMVEGTGKMACPNCHTKAAIEGQAVINRLTDNRKAVAS